MASSSNEKKQEKLNISSPQFDAKKALYAREEDIVYPKSKAPVYSNISCFVETEDGIFPKEVKVPSKKKCSAIPNTVKTKEETEDAPVSSRKSKKNKNVLTRMENLNESKNVPLYFLKKCMDEKLRVKVVTRNISSIRGFCIGFIDAFDRHMNIILKDVFETWKRPRKNNRGPVEKTCEKVDDDEDESYLLTSSGYLSLHKHGAEETKKRNDEKCYKVPALLVTKRLKKKTICERYISQLMILGSQIVFVTLDQSGTSTIK